MITIYTCIRHEFSVWKNYTTILTIDIHSHYCDTTIYNVKSNVKLL